MADRVENNHLLGNFPTSSNVLLKCSERVAFPISPKLGKSSGVKSSVSDVGICRDSQINDSEKNVMCSSSVHSVENTTDASLPSDVIGSAMGNSINMNHSVPPTSEWKTLVLQALYDYYDPFNEPSIGFVLHTIGLLRGNLRAMSHDIGFFKARSDILTEVIKERDQLSNKLLEYSVDNQQLAVERNNYRDEVNQQRNLLQNYTDANVMTRTIDEQSAQIRDLEKKLHELGIADQNNDNGICTVDGFDLKYRDQIKTLKDEKEAFEQRIHQYEELIIEIINKFVFMVQQSSTVSTDGLENVFNDAIGRFQQ